MKKITIFVCKILLSIFLLAAVIVSPIANAASKVTVKVKQVMVKIINTSGEHVGTAMLTQHTGAVQIHITAKNLTPGIHGVHFHEVGKCETPDFKSAGAHLNPNQKQHGFNNPKGFHSGDLLNIQVGSDGTVDVKMKSKNVTLMTGAPNSLLKPGGTALVIHDKEDDYVTDPSGNSGDRIACGPIQE
ncbi:superoxide dismutase family protein [Cohnella sp. WQ 127256]|uniref:superoxide dismutase family protein n=1 Tax=Cohnella sp. WQ 127256 TaxID=2938790 RepID=UPI0021196D89|nr:superoxide dismutase family protein [Cohnella sp. WQ 127256]